MASSVSSERAFSSAGITICKQRNCLDADIVEALQCLKALIQQDLMVREVASLTDDEEDLDFMDEQAANQDSTAIEVVRGADNVSWGAPVPDGDNSDSILEVDGHDTDIE